MGPAFKFALLTIAALAALSFVREIPVKAGLGKPLVTVDFPCQEAIAYLADMRALVRARERGDLAKIHDLRISLDNRARRMDSSCRRLLADCVPIQKLVRRYPGFLSKSPRRGS
jgi:hypothetical protein